MLEIIIEDTIETTTIVIDEAGVVAVPISEGADNQAERRVDGLYVPLPYRTPVEQSKGDSEEVVMSQKAVTGELDMLASLVSNKVDKVVGSGLIPLSKVDKLDGIADEATKNSTDAHLLDRVNHTGEQPISTITSLESVLISKVDKVDGFELSSNDFTEAEKSKLSNIATEATKNQSDTFLLSRVNHTGEQPISSVTGLETSLLNKVNRVTGKQLSEENYTTAEKDKLNLVQPEATKNSTDAQLRDRTTHTGVQPISSISNLQTELDSKLTKPTDGKLYGVRNGVFVPIMAGSTA